ncbi:hypothetical protein D3C81_1679390 [compost metagenome]
MMVIDLGVSRRGAVNFGDDISSTLNVSCGFPVISVASSSTAVAGCATVVAEVSARLTEDQEATAKPSAV